MINYPDSESDIAMVGHTSLTFSDWIFDTDATSYYIEDKYLFTDLQPATGIIGVVDNRCIPVIDQGIVQFGFRLSNWNVSTTILYHDLLVPNVGNNSLFSWAVVWKSGFKITGEGDEIQLERGKERSFIK